MLCQTQRKQDYITALFHEAAPLIFKALFSEHKQGLQMNIVILTSARLYNLMLRQVNL